MSIAVYMPIGPSDDEVARAADVLDSVEAFSESLRWIVLVDDAREPRGLERRLACRAPCELVVLHNPRNGVGNGRTGGMCVSNLLAYGYIHRHTDAVWVLKLDTDSLVIGPFEERLRAAIAARNAAQARLLVPSVAEWAARDGGNPAPCLEIGRAKLLLLGDAPGALASLEEARARGYRSQELDRLVGEARAALGR